MPARTVGLRDLEEMLDYPDEYDKVPDRSTVASLPSFDMETWLDIGHPDWKRSGDAVVCSGDVLNQYAAAMRAIDSFVEAGYRQEWNRWLEVFGKASDLGLGVRLAFD